MTRVTRVVIASIVFAAAIGGYYWAMLSGPSQESSNRENTMMSEAFEKALETNEDGLSKATAVIQTTRGKIKYKFYTRDAPKTVHRIAELIQKGFYNGLIFHRVVPGFVVQGGDPTGSGMGGSGVKLPAEFNSRKHEQGTLAMARAADPNSADSQFYICLSATPHLDGQYTVFGQVMEGQDVVNQIQVGDRMTTVSLEY